MINLYADDNTMLVEAGDITNEKTGQRIENATVSFTIKYAGSPLSGQTWPLVLTEDSNGDFWGLVSSDTDIVAGRKYTLILLVEADGNKADIRKTIYAKTREFDESQ